MKTNHCYILLLLFFFSCSNPKENAIKQALAANFAQQGLTFESYTIIDEKDTNNFITAKVKAKMKNSDKQAVEKEATVFLNRTGDGIWSGSVK